MTAIRSRKYLDGSRGQECTLRIPGVCTGDIEQTVAAHIRDRHTGKGGKASDLSICDACWACHNLFDGRSGVLSREDWLTYALRGLQETIERRVGQELLSVIQDIATPFHARPVKPRKPPEQRAKVPAGKPMQSRSEWPESRKMQSRPITRKSETQQ